MKVTGIGNGKNIFLDIFFKQTGVKAENISYSAEELKKVPNNELIILIYDGLSINEILELPDFMSHKTYIPIFLDTDNIHVFGMNNFAGYNHNIGCPKCITKIFANKYFKLKLYKNLFSQTKYMSFDFIYQEELNHFVLILTELIKKDYLAGSFFNYSLLSNKYNIEHSSGLSKCSVCDNYSYTNDDMKNYIEEFDF